MNIRIADKHDLEGALAIYESARAFMENAGNASQWSASYPSRRDIQADINRGTLMVCEDDAGTIVGCFVFEPGPNLDYLDIRDGAWPNEVPYFCIHRFAVLEQGKGVGGFMLDWIIGAANNLRCDTHEDNVAMRGLLESRGFSRRGTIRLKRDGSERVAYAYERPDDRDLKDKSIFSWLPWRKTGLLK